MKRIFALLPALLLLAACGSGDEKQSATTATVAATTVATQAAVATAAPTVAQATAAPRPPANPRLVLATTTSTVDSGLLDELLPAFEKATGYKVVPLSLGSGQALATAERGEADVLLVHSPDAERTFVQAGHGLDRRLVMHNDFILIGPDKDPAQIKTLKVAADGLTRIANASAAFVSRGDNSGTHALELKLWKQAAITPAGQRWYTEAGAGMGQTLQIANDRQAYTISDRATYLAQKKNLQLAVLIERDPALLNIYHVIRVNPSKSDKINSAGAVAFADFLVSPAAQAIIAGYGKAKYGEPLFFPDAGKDETKLGS